MNRPETIIQLQELVQEHTNLRPFGGRTKTESLSASDLGGVIPLDMGGLSGIIEYDPNEYTFTAYAGTPIAEISAALGEYGQYMPFDPLFVASGATLGGTVATNMSGSGRFRYGGVRDFILGTHFVDGQARLVQGGGKVVKNAAGFDLPKFMVGSLGRYGVLVDLTFKVFPKPAEYITLFFDYGCLADALQATFALAVTPFEIDALDMRTTAVGAELIVRLGGIGHRLPERARLMRTFLQTNTAVVDTGDEVNRQLFEGGDDVFWQMINTGLPIVADESLVKIPVAPKQLFELSQCEAIKSAYYTSGGNVAWLVTGDMVQLGKELEGLGLCGLVVKGDGGGLIGRRRGEALARRVKQALDPHGRFGKLY